MLGQVDLLGQNHLALIEGALHLDILQLFTQIGSLLQQCNDTVLDFQVHVGALGDLLSEGTLGCDCELLATVERS